ncbi:hypothetical protein SAMN05660443_1505 [Marinospirillum celere]|uniref:Flagellar Assembly Protein A N-terminal region domain-containing protein n=1 Tax=Marinospirillum celere TaxID=1122252 RepID=A0A1I1GKT9_9GAMM|nr:FapA family protein [Marinospirillum celere]SFC12379.1 hypothetical protein SAMN05660443_1505 [Marinospirillum celere]
MEPLTDEELMLSVPTPDELGLSFREEKETGDFYATYEPVGITQPLEPEQFPQVMEMAGFDPKEYPVDPAALSIFLDAMRRGESCNQRLGGPIDARPEVFASPNQMLAGVVIHPPQGKGKDLTRDTLEQALKQSKIVRGLLEESLKELTSETTTAALRETQKPVCMVVAYGEPAYDGTDAWLETLIEDIADRRPQMDEDGNVNFLELGDFPHVEAEQALVRRHPPTNGKSGWTVTGRTIKGRNGKDLTLKPKDDSVKLAEGDENLLLSTTTGMPVVHDKGAHVEQVLRLENVGLKTGHVRFDGSVHVKGNVDPGMKIVVTGDVKVGGLVEAAYIKAGGFIEIGGGVIGRKQADKDKHPEAKKDDDAKGKVNDAYLKAGTQVKARFIQEAKVEADQEVIVQKQILHSEITAGIRIAMPGRGTIVGGIARAKEVIDVGVSGAMANVPTRLIAGETGDIKQRIANVNNQLKQLEVQRQQLMDIVAKIKKLRKPITEEKKQQIIKARDGLNEKENTLYDLMAELEKEQKDRQSARVQVRVTCYPGTVIHLGEDEFSPRNDLGKVTFVLRDGEIIMR